MQKTFPKEITFQSSWRPYQSRVLSELDGFLDDKRLHIIAAPGSGKTILGLEVIRRLNRPTLIISPTLAIRDQWIQRFTELFMPAGSPTPDWISKDIRKPFLLTSTTYQGLHMAYAGVNEEAEVENGNEEIEEAEKEEPQTEPAEKKPLKKKGTGQEFIKILKDAQIETLVVDEAHHLRSEWWKTLTDVHDQLEGVRVVALTATPPYDVTYQEWQRYQEFCGPVDEEISVPELVLDNNLCPHQDYVYISQPTAKELEQINSFHQELNTFCQELFKNDIFISSLEKHPAILEPDKHIEEILANPEYFSSIAIFLNHLNRPFPRRILSILGTDKSRIPSLSLEWFEILLTNCLYGTDSLLGLPEDVLKGLRQKLSRIGAVDRKNVFLVNNKTIAKSLIQSMSKMDSINEIVRLENSLLKDSLRMVILTDYIRYEDLPQNPEDVKPLKRLGVIPIFESIRRNNISSIKLGCLCGSIIIIPKESESLLRKIASERKIPTKNISLLPVNSDHQYAQVNLDGIAQEQAVSLITQLFTQGGITVLVGTKSLLGEGWDAPCINSLILASFVGSFVLSNQMRGRAIRTCSGDKNKIANIWHLVCLQKPQNPLGTVILVNNFGPDWDMIQRRFKAFVGVSNVDVSIENGFDRLGLKISSVNTNETALANENTKKLAQDREGLRAKWEAALKRGVDGVRMVQEIKAPKDNVPKDFIFQNTLRWLIVQGTIWGTYLFGELLPRNGRNLSFKQYLIWIAAAGGISLAVALPFFIKSAYLYLRYGPIEGSVHQIAEAVLRTLVFLNIIKTDPQKLGVKTEQNKNGWVLCYLEGGSSFEKSVFLDAVQTVLGPVDNPRYLITRNSTLLNFIRKDFHPVPELIAERKEKAEYFEKMWGKYVGPTTLIYTRNPEGRRILIKARGASLSSHFLKKTERLNAWK